MNAVPKLNPVRDRKYLDWLRDQPCILTNWRATEASAVDPMRIGTLGKGIKSSDDEALPVRHELHVMAHNQGEMTMFRKQAPDWLLREALRAYAREFYRQYLSSERETQDTQERAGRKAHAEHEGSSRLSGSTTTSPKDHTR